MDYTALAIACEEISAGDGSTLHDRDGDEPRRQHPARLRQRRAEKRVSPPGRARKALGAFCLTEPHAGSDAAAITTRARDPATTMSLNGVKQFITSGKNAELAIVFAVHRQGRRERRASAHSSCRPSTPGYQVARIEDKTGQRASDTAQIVLENCKVPASDLLAQEGMGYRIALANLESGRINASPRRRPGWRAPRSKPPSPTRASERAWARR